MNFQQRIKKWQMLLSDNRLNKEENFSKQHELFRLESIKKEEEKRRHERGQAFLQSIPPIFRGATLDHFYINYPEQKKVKNIAYRFVETANNRIEEGTNLILHGRPGTGKTMLSLIMCQILSKYNFDVRYESSLQFLRLFRDKNFESYYSFENHINYYARIPFLVIDEVTESRVTGNQLTHWEKEMLFALIDARYQQKKCCTFIISNRSKTELIEQLGDRIFGRLYQTSVILAFNWESYRKNGGIESSCNVIKQG